MRAECKTDGCTGKRAHNRGIYGGLCLDCAHEKKKERRRARDRERAVEDGSIANPPATIPEISLEGANGALEVLRALVDDAEAGAVVLLHRDGKTYRVVEVTRLVELEL